MPGIPSNSGGADSSRSRGPAALLIVCGLLAGGTVAVGCGSGDSSTTSTVPATTAAQSATGSKPGSVATDKVAIANYKFAPETVTVKAGTNVTWTNSDSTAHTATADDGSFDTGDLNKGDAKSVTLDEPGTFTYYCRFHPFMKATVEVQ